MEMTNECLATTPAISNANENDVTDAGKREHVLERLNKRNKDRQNYLDVKLELRNKEQPEREGADYFAHVFAERAREIETRIQNINDAATKKPSGGDAPGLDLRRLFADVASEINELQHYLTTSTIFLTDYKIKACQTVITDLASKCDANRQRLMPKKKFGFSARKAALKTMTTATAVANDKTEHTDPIGDKLDAPEKTLHMKSTNPQFIWTLSNREREYICLCDTEVNGKDITISNLNKCFVELQGYAGSVQISSASNCIFLCGPISRSLFAESCNETTFAVACQQLRLHSSSSCRIFLHVTSRAIIEDSKNIELATYNYEYPGIERDFIAAGLNKGQNNYTDVADFNWLSPDVPSPNWKLLKCDADINWHESRRKFKDESKNDHSL